MRSFLGSSILQGAAIFDLAEDLDEAKVLYELAKTFYSGFKILILDLSNTEERILAVNIDPDMADIKKGFAVAVIAE